ncbi:MAG TPA: DUF748 domain-containing protein, partial [Gammaproteobacteria bacterium]|nr:DUF748 domain-containing protein [Gammaproteobacteria bacterium]
DASLLSSSFSFSGKASGGGNVVFNGKFDPFKKQPTFKIDAKLTNLPVASVHNFLKHYSMVDVKGGKFSMYLESAAANGLIKGYIKPFIKDLKIGSPQNGNPIEAIVDAAAGVVAAVVENSQQKTVATQINISGEIDDPDTSILSVIGYLLRHGFIQALLPQVDHKVQMEDVYFGKKQPISKFPTYKHSFQSGP